MSSLTITPLSHALGAQISGVDIAQPLNVEQRDAIEQALLKHQVLFFRNQPVTAQQQARFAANFGDLHIHPIYPNVPEQPEVLILDTAQTDVRDNAVEIQLDLPEILAAIADRITGRLKTEGQKLLEKK